MFDTQKAIADWRRQMRAVGVKDANVLAELESHLRAEIEALTAAGHPEAEGFQLAAARVGSPDSVAREFSKLQNRPVWPVIIGSALWLCATIRIAAILFDSPFGGQLRILAWQTFSLVTGYNAVLLTGLFGLCYIGYRSFHGLTPFRQQSLNRAVYWFTHVAASLVVTGLILGMAWSRQVRGQYVGAAGHREPYEIGAWCVGGWLVAMVALQHFGRIGDRALMILSVFGNIVVSVAWLGAAAAITRQEGRIFLRLAVFVAIHLCAIVIGVAHPTDSSRQSPAH